MTVQLASTIFDRPPASISSSILGSPLVRKADQASALMRPAAHRVNIAERVGGRNLAEDVGIVNNGREEVDRLHQRQLGRELIHSGVVGCVEADQNIGIVLPG